MQGGRTGGDDDSGARDRGARGQCDGQLARTEEVRGQERRRVSSDSARRGGRGCGDGVRVGTGVGGGARL